MKHKGRQPICGKCCHPTTVDINGPQGKRTATIYDRGTRNVHDCAASRRKELERLESNERKRRETEEL